MTRKKEPERRVEAHPGVYPYSTEQGIRYRYQFDVPPGVDGGRKVKTKRGFPTEQDAWDAMQERKRELRLSGYAEPNDETLQEYFDRWMRDTGHGRRPNTNRGYALAWKRLPQHLLRLPLRSLTPTHIRAFYGELVTRYAPSTARDTRNTLAMILVAAHRERLIPFNPSAGIKLPINRDADTRADFDASKAWSVDEQRQFLAATVAYPDHVLWRFLLDSGLRIGEAVALTWDDLDWDKRLVRVRRTLTVDDDGKRVVGRQPKTPTSRRDVTLFAETMTHLERHRTAQKVRRISLGPLWLDRNYIFDIGDGSLAMPDTLLLRFRKAVRAQKMRPLTLHGCRHTMAVTWLKAGKSPAMVAARLGHKSAAFTLDVYAKVSQDWQQSDADDVEAFMKRDGNPLPPPEPEGKMVQWPEQG